MKSKTSESANVNTSDTVTGLQGKTDISNQAVPK